SRARRQLRNAGCVRQDVSDGYLGFPVGAEGWPVVGDRGVEVDSASLGEEVDGGGDHAFATREADEQRAAIDCPLSAGVGQARPGVEDQLSIQVGGNLEAAFDIAL